MADPLQHPTVETTDSHGYRYVTTSPDWKQMCMGLPCSSALAWPGYDTKCLEDTIDGQKVIIQLWKGCCQQFFGREEFPGGIGGEVGVYRRVTTKTLPNLDFLSPVAREFYKAMVVFGGEKLWWPDPALTPTINFALINDHSREGPVGFFATRPEATYWANKWMQFSSYDEYEKAKGVPPWPTGFRMRFTINNRTYPDW